MPDYTKQLEEILKAVSHSTTSPWLIAAFSSSLGVVGGFIGQWINMRLTAFNRRNELRGVLYRDLAGMFLAVHSIMNNTEIPETENYLWQKGQLRRCLLFRGEKYCLDRPDIYMEPHEHSAGEMLYSYIHSIVGDETSMCVNTGVALRAFGAAVHDGSLRSKCFQKFLGGKKQASFLLHSAEAYYQQNEEGLRATKVETKPLDHSSLSE